MTNSKAKVKNAGDSGDYLDQSQFLDFLKAGGRPLKDKHLKFRRDEIVFSKRDYRSKKGPFGKPMRILHFEKHGGNKLVIEKSEAKAYLSHLKEMSIDITFRDIRKVVREYGEVLERPRKKGMRSQRNFTGKVEDEIRGKLAEECLSKYLRKLGGVRFPVSYDLLPPGLLRDEGDFEFVISRRTGKKNPLPKNMVIAVKSTNGYFAFAIPENEWSWPGKYYVSVRPHLQDDFMLYLVREGLGLPNKERRTFFGWLEIDGWLTKNELMTKGFIGTKLPGGYHTGERWTRRNLIMHPLQLRRKKADMEALVKKYKKYQ